MPVSSVIDLRDSRRRHFSPARLPLRWGPCNAILPNHVWARFRRIALHGPSFQKNPATRSLMPERFTRVLCSRACPFGDPARECSPGRPCASYSIGMTSLYCSAGGGCVKRRIVWETGALISREKSSRKGRQGSKNAKKNFFCLLCSLGVLCMRCPISWYSVSRPGAVKEKLPCVGY